MTHQLRVKEEMKTNDYKDGNEKITLKYSGLFGSNDRKRELELLFGSVSNRLRWEFL